MLPPCVLLIEEALPEIRKRVAKEMYSSGSNQVEISRLLGVSQAMVSKYLKDDNMASCHMEDYIENLTGDLTVTALSGGNKVDMTAKFCSACMVMKNNNTIDDAYLKRTGFPLPNVSCFKIRCDNDLSFATDELVQALEYLNRRSIKDLIPEVKVNIATCIKDCKGGHEVVAFPGRLTYVDGKLMAIKTPELGASNHLSSMICTVCKNNPGMISVMNIAFNEIIKKALENMKANIFYLVRKNNDLLEELGRTDLKGHYYIVDRGDFGIEPCLYILGNSSLSVAARAVKVQKEIDAISRE